MRRGTTRRRRERDGSSIQCGAMEGYATAWIELLLPEGL
jgi:hypothetical protein